MRRPKSRSRSALSLVAADLRGEVEVTDAVTLNGYELIAVIRDCEECRTYRVRSLKYKSEYALKLYRRGSTPRDQALREVEALRALAHPGVVSLYDSFECDGSVAVVVDYCAGGTLEDELAGCGPRPCAPERFASIARQLLLALQHCHAQGVCHGALQPAAVLFRDARRTVVKLSDFANSVRRGEPPRPSGVTFAFEPPEVFAREPVDAVLRDVWMLGVTLAWVANGHTPWLTGDLRLIPQIVLSQRVWLQPTLDSEVRTAVMGMLRRAAARTSIETALGSRLFREEPEDVKQPAALPRRGGSGAIGGHASQATLRLLPPFGPPPAERSPLPALVPRRSTL